MTDRIFFEPCASRRVLRLALLLVFLTATISGCSISNSSEWISDSISSPSDWSRSSSDSSGSSSDSSSGDEDSGGGAEEPETPQDAASYAEDVTQLAYTFGKQGGDIGALRTSVSKLAAARGITNWEVDSLTCQSIGQGVGQAGLSESEFTKFSKSLFGDDLTKANELRKGYDASKPPGVSSGSPEAAAAPAAETAP